VIFGQIVGCLQLSKLLIIILLFSIGFTANPLPFAPDKQLHAFSSYAITDILEYNKFTWWQSGLSLLAIGIIKESVDDVYDSEDIKANMWGWLGYRLVHWEF